MLMFNDIQHHKETALCTDIGRVQRAVRYEESGQSCSQKILDGIHRLRSVGRVPS